LPPNEQMRLAALRQERVARTVNRLIRDGSEMRRSHAVFLVDLCLRAIPDDAMRHHPAWLTSDTFRDEVSSMLAAYLDRG
jgi:hypothetical protein